MDQSEAFCSQYCESIGIDCIGSARPPEDPPNRFGGYLLIEDSSYWQARIEEGDDFLGEIGKSLQYFEDLLQIHWRLQAIRGERSYAEQDMVFCIVYRNSGISGAPYDLRKESYQIPKESFFGNLVNILRDGSSDYQVPNRTDRDLLICTHSERDKCCSRFGYPIYKELHQSETLNMSIWRSSHIGGHRMAPTLIELPVGRYWGYMNMEVSFKLANCELPSNQEIDYHYRGKAGLLPAEQHVEKIGLVKYREDWNSSDLIVKTEDNTDSWEIKIYSGDLQVEGKISREIAVNEIGKTRCAIVKPVTEFNFLE